MNAQIRAILLEGNSTVCRPRGNSMTPYISSGDVVKIDPITEDTELKKGMIVFCSVRGRYYIHMITAIKNKKLYQISNAHGHVNGWTTRDHIFGTVRSLRA